MKYEVTYRLIHWQSLPAILVTMVDTHTFARTYLARYPDNVVDLAVPLRHSSLNTIQLYSRSPVSQPATQVEQLKINAYSLRDCPKKLGASRSRSYLNGNEPPERSFLKERYIAHLFPERPLLSPL